MAQSADGTSAPPAIERFVRQFVTTYKAAVLYPPSSAIPSANAEKTAELLADAAGDTGNVTLTISKNRLEVDGALVGAGQAAAKTLALELYHRGVAWVRFDAAADSDALLALLGTLREPIEMVEQSGGFAAMLWDAGVHSIAVTDATTSVVDAEIDVAEGQDEAAPLPDHDEIHRLLTSRQQKGTQGHRTLVRFLLDRAAIASYVAASHRRASSSDTDDEPGAEILAMARIIDSLSEEERAKALAAVADALRELPAGELRAQIAERLLSSARTDEAIAALVQQVGLDEMSLVLTEGISPEEVSADGLVRALRNLAHISLAGREEVVNSAGAAMRGAGIAEPIISEVLTTAMPTHLSTGSDEGADGPSDDVARVIQLVDRALVTTGTDAEFPEIEALRDEASFGLSDGDVTGALVTLVVLDIGTEEFYESLHLVEGSLGILLARGEFETAARAADTLLAAASDAPAEQRDHMLEAVGRLAAPPEMRALHQAMRVYDRGSAEALACEQLLRTLGMLAIDPSLELLAEEPDMALRKSMVEVISSVAAQHLEQLGQRITDSRWYFVRNVVAIMGSTRCSEALPYLERTLHHTDSRVRRESLRAITLIPDEGVAGLLAGALDDPDAEVVQIAARYLGRFRNQSAVPALIEIARGEGAGNRELGPRVRAIEALGLIGSPEALPVLEALAAPRRLAGGRSREIASVAKDAVDLINRVSHREVQ